MSLTSRSAYLLIQAVKAAYPEGVIVVGGAHIDALPQSVATLEVPFAFHGECDFEFARFCRSILGGQSPTPSPGLITNGDGDVMIGPQTIVEDLDVLPRPAYDLLPIDRYYSPSSHLRTVSFISSRGCPHKCIFCSKLQQKKYRFLGTENLLNQIQWLTSDLGVQWIEFVDEIFTLRRNRIVDLCEGILRRDLRFHWGCGTRVDRIDEELLVLMKRAGCRKIGFGIESGSERVLNVIRKNITLEQTRSAIALCRRHAVKTQTCFILGHPTESLSEMRETVRFARRLKSNYPSFGKMIAIPGSELFELAIRDGDIKREAWDDFIRAKGPVPLYVPNGVSPKALHRIFRWAWFYAYFWPTNLWNNRDAIFNPVYLSRAIKAFWDFACRRDY